MSVSQNSAVGSMRPANESEAMADLSQNLDEALDLQLGFGAIGGLRHSAACDAAERSQRRYDDRNHRLHEARMKKLGVEGEEPEAEDMAQQVLIRSPVTHNHYHEPKSEAPPQHVPPQQQPQPELQQQSAWSKTWPWLLAAAAGMGGAGTAAALIPKPEPPPPAVESVVPEMPKYDVEKWTP